MGTTAAVGFIRNNKPYLVGINSEGYPLAMIPSLQYIISAFGLQEVKHQLSNTPQGFRNIAMFGHVMENFVFCAGDIKLMIHIKTLGDEVDMLKKGHIGRSYPVGDEPMVFHSTTEAIEYVNYIYLIKPPSIHYNDVLGTIRTLRTAPMRITDAAQKKKDIVGRLLSMS